MRLPLAALVLAASPALAQVTVTPGDGPVGRHVRVGIGVNGGGDYHHFVGANLVDDPGFEGAADVNGFARQGWPWYTSGAITASVDTSTRVHGAQSQKVVVSSGPSSMSQGRADLPQAPVSMKALAGHTYRIRAQVKADRAAHVRLGLLDGGWQGRPGPATEVGTEWKVVTFDYEPAADHAVRGVTVRFEDAATYWVDDLVAFDVDDVDPATGLSARFVQRLRELEPGSLRLGGLGVNGIPLESYLRDSWDLDHGPPAMQPDMDLNTFLRLCRELGAIPFLTVPPAFSDGESWKLGDLTDHVIDAVFADHGNLVDYLGGDASTTYGARREADGFGRWDLEFEAIYLELGNELWGTPDDRWDMDPAGDESQRVQMENHATYCTRRMTEMKGRPGWRTNLRVGFGGRSPDIWLGGWPGSYDGTLVPAIGALTDFSTIDLYYGKGDPATDADADIFAGLFSEAFATERDVKAMKAAFAEANGGADIETTVYEGNAVWKGYEANVSMPSAAYAREVSLGAAVSLVDVYAAAERAGVTLNHHFHATGNAWAVMGPWPELRPKPAFLALQLLNGISGEQLPCAVEGAGTFDAPLTGETGVPVVACSFFRQPHGFDVLLVNRHLTEPREVTVRQAMAPVSLRLLTGEDILANNEAADVVQLREEALSGELVESTLVTVPPFSAVVLHGTDGEAGAGGSGGSGGDGRGGGGAGGSGGTDAGGSGPGAKGTSGPQEGCSCGAAGDEALVLALVMAGLLRRRRA